MKNLGLVILICIGLVLASTPATAAVEGRACLPEPTNELIAYGDLITCNIDPDGDVDQFRFSGTAGEQVAIQLSFTSGTAYGCIDLFGPDNSKIGSDCDWPVRIYITLTQSGTYTILVYAEGNGSTASYTLALERVTPPSDTATSICPGCTISDEINPVGDLDLFFFQGTSGNIVMVQGTPTSGTASVCIDLFSPDGSKIGTHCGYPAKIETTLTQSGTYTLLVDGRDTRSYDVTYQCIGSCGATLRNYIDITSLPDMNGSGYDEVATLQAKDGKPIVIIKDSKNDTFLGSLNFFNADWVPIALTSLPDMNANGSSELAVLAYHKDTGLVIVNIKDVQTKQVLNWIQFFNADWRPKGLTSVKDMNGNSVDELAVLAVKKGAGNVEVRIKDAFTRALLNSISFPK